MLKFDGEVFAGTLLTLPAPLFVPSGTTYTMKVWSPREVPVLFKLEGTSEAERSVTHTGSGWEELTFDFSGKIGEPSSTDITGFVVFPDFAVRTQENVIYFDDIVFLDSGQCP